MKKQKKKTFFFKFYIFVLSPRPCHISIDDCGCIYVVCFVCFSCSFLFFYIFFFSTFGTPISFTEDERTSKVGVGEVSPLFGFNNQKELEIT